MVGSHNRMPGRLTFFCVGIVSRENNDRQENLLEYTPRVNIAWEDVEQQIFLLIPKYKNLFLRKHVLPRMRRPNRRLRLDEYGSCVWQHIDGDRTVHEIAVVLREKFGDAIEPVFDRLGLFMSLLHRNQYILLEKKTIHLPSCKPGTPAYE
jgi:hypothetical protein